MRTGRMPGATACPYSCAQLRAEPVEVQAVAADLVVRLLRGILDRRADLIQHDIVDAAAPRAHHVRVSGGNVGVVAIGSLAELSSSTSPTAFSVSSVL